MINNLSKHRSVVDSYMRSLRDIKIQGNRELFRTNIRRIGRVIGYELSKDLEFELVDVQTPLAQHSQFDVSDELVVVTILRAGLPLHEGILDVFPNAENGFISAFRKHDGTGFSIEAEYVACPALDDKILILNDSMLATGRSIDKSLSMLLQYGSPKKIIFTSVIASQEGIDFLKAKLKHNFDLWVGAIDSELNDEKYIVPGLGDAGDLSFGEKLQN